jgi:hypothetical protein
MVALGDVDELKIHGESAYDPPQLLNAHSVDPPPESLVQFRVVVEAQALAKKPDLLLGLEKFLALLLDQDPTKHAPEEVDVPPQRLVFWFEADPGRKVSVPGTRHRRKSAADIHAR